MKELETKLFSLHSIYTANGCKDEPNLPPVKKVEEEVKVEEV
jgi:hypothetical protein